jgi:hypothetical protein
VTTPSPQDRLAGALSTVPDACREVLAWVERCKLRRRGDRLVLVLVHGAHFGRAEGPVGGGCRIAYQ